MMMDDDNLDDFGNPKPTQQQQPTSVPTPISAPKPSIALPWVEKYRPMLLQDVAGNIDSVNKLKAIAQQGNLPNLILTGPPGCGKTTSVLALAREMLGSQYKQAVLELNASDSRGIDSVRNEIKQFAQIKVTLPPGKHKIIILDEADSMTKGAQQSLRRVMEMFSSTTRFALACNTSSKIIEPIQSRCAILRFTRLDDPELLSRVKFVLKAENVTNFDDSGLKAIIFTSQGDMRQALNTIQATYSSFGQITAESVYKVVDQPHPEMINTMLQYCNDHRARDAISIVKTMYTEGYSTQDILNQVYNVCKYANLSEHKRLEFIRQIAVVQLRVAEGCDSFLQLTALIARMCAISDDLVADLQSPIALAGK